MTKSNSKRELTESDYDSSSSESENESKIDEVKFELSNYNYYNNNLEHIEDIDVDKLNHIIENKEHFIKLIKKMDDYKDVDDFEESFKTLKKILNKSRNGMLNVIYRQRNKVGRYYTIRKLGMQNMLRPIRQTVAKDYIDIDVSNCGPTLLKYICDRNKIECPTLKEYCKDRDKFIKEDGMTKTKGKKLCIAMLNSDKSFKLSDKQTEFKKLNKEIIKIQNVIAKKYNKKFLAFKKRIEDLDKEYIIDDDIEEWDEECKDLDNMKGRFLSRIIFDTEAKMLKSMYDYFGNPKSSILCFDGIMIKSTKEVKNDDGKIEIKKVKCDNNTLKECEKHILKQTGIKLTLAIKPFDDKFKDSEFKDMDEYVDERLEYFSDIKTLVSKNVELEHLQECVNNSIIYAENGGKGYYFTKNQDYSLANTLEKWTIVYKPLKEEDLCSSLNRNCNVINPYYDPKFIQDDNKPFDTRSQKYLFTNIGKKFGKDDSFITHCIKNMVDASNKNSKSSIDSYNKVEFYPYLKRKGIPNMHGVFNLFPGFPLEDEMIYDHKLRFEDSHFYKHLKQYVTNNDAGELKHLLDTWADGIQKPYIVRANAHIFYGPQGSGKSLIGIFLTNLFGRNNSVTFINLSKAFDKFNGIGVHKLVKIFEELGDKNGKFNKQAADNGDFLKGMITALFEMVEDKGIDAYQTIHCARYVFFTNHEANLNIETGCRRYTMHSVSGEKAKNNKYFAPIWKEINNPAFMKCAFEYFANREYDEKDIMECYNTRYKKDQVVDSLGMGHKYLKYLVENDYETPNIKNKSHPIKLVLEDGYIDATLLGLKFLDWVSLNSGVLAGNKCSTAGFTTQLKKLGIEPQSHRYTLRDGTKGKNIRSFKIDEETLLLKFRARLEDQYFTFDKLNNDDNENKREEKNSKDSDSESDEGDYDIEV